MKALRNLVVALVLAGAFARAGTAPLAITEVMAESSRSAQPSFRGGDFWEVTNFGTNTVNLDGFKFSDSHQEDKSADPFVGLQLRAGESVIILKTNRFVNTPEQFKEWWWGDARAQPDLQIRYWLDNGLNGGGWDQVWLFDAEGQVVDMVDWTAEATEGHSFVYDSAGIFGRPSSCSNPPAGGAFPSVKAADCGSPGVTTGAVPLQILEFPRAQELYGYGDATFTVRAQGVPRPRYQWFFNDQALSDATTATLSLPDVTPAQLGRYSVVVSNGLETVRIPAVDLTMTTNPFLPMVVAPPKNVSVFPGQTALFTVSARGFPIHQYQWQLDGIDLPGETNRTLGLAVPAGALDATNRCLVRVWNEVGSAEASATLTVSPPPRLRITEVMANATNRPPFRHPDWFELTNFDTYAVDLQGYRIYDPDPNSSADLPDYFTRAFFTVTNSVIIQPGEAVIFVESTSRADFLQWWGETNLPSGLQIISWAGWGLGNPGEVIQVWNAAARSPSDPTVCTATFLSVLGFSAELYPTCDGPGCSSLYLRDSVAGEAGAFPAAEDGDVGSPGVVVSPPHFLKISRGDSTVQLHCLVEPGKFYQLNFKDRFTDSAWSPLETQFTGLDATLEFEDATTDDKTSRFYQLEEIP